VLAALRAKKLDSALSSTGLLYPLASILAFICAKMLPTGLVLSPVIALRPEPPNALRPPPKIEPPLSETDGPHGKLVALPPKITVPAPASTTSALCDDDDTPLNQLTDVLLLSLFSPLL